MGKYIKIAKINDVAEGEGKSILVGEESLALFRSGGKYYALKNTCPHAGGPLGEGVIHNGTEVICPWHGWRFDITTGRCLANPSYVQKKYALQIDGDDILAEL